jgi:tRNA (mo5U34)-methyltransferase
VNDINWWHTIDLLDGRKTPGRIKPEYEWPKLQVPELAGETVLDIGTWDGYYAFECEARGASRVVATDSYMWKQSTGRAGFDYAHAARKSNVEAVEIDVLDLEPAVFYAGNDEWGVQFDIVLFLGVLYHMRHPLLAIERAASMLKPGGLMILETYLSETPLSKERPALIFPDNYMKGGPAFFGPNALLVHHWLAMAGLVGRTVHESGRLVVHAQWRLND